MIAQQQLIVQLKEQESLREICLENGDNETFETVWQKLGDI
jgi:hypothetical protein